MTVGERIKNRRLELGFSVEEVANRLGKNRATIYRYESGDIEDLPTTVLESIATVLDITPAELMGWEKNKHSTAPAAPASVRIPVLGRVAAGSPIFADEEIIDYEDIPEAMTKGGEYFGLQIRGDSMEPRMRNGDVVIVRKQEDADNGDTVIALVNGNDAVCKKLKKYSDGSIALMSTNPAYDPMFFAAKDVEDLPVRIIGKVKELRAKY